MARPLLGQATGQTAYWRGYRPYRPLDRLQAIPPKLFGIFFCDELVSYRFSTWIFHAVFSSWKRSDLYVQNSPSIFGSLHVETFPKKTRKATFPEKRATVREIARWSVFLANQYGANGPSWPFPGHLSANAQVQNSYNTQPAPAGPKESTPLWLGATQAIVFI